MRPNKPLLPLICSTFLTLCTVAQTGSHDTHAIPLGASQMTSMVDPYWKSGTTEAGLNWEKMTGLVSGSMFYSENWENGYILLANGRTARDIPLRYNIYTGEIYFKIDSLVRVIDPALPVKEFGFNNSANPSEKTAVFRNGYPTTGKNNPATFYECIVSGPLSLLKHYTKRLSERTSLSQGKEKVINDTQDWYLYDSTSNTLQEIKPTKKGITEALPQQADHIKKIIQEKNLSLKSNTDWIILFESLK